MLIKIRVWGDGCNSANKDTGSEGISRMYPLVLFTLQGMLVLNVHLFSNNCCCIAAHF